MSFTGELPQGHGKVILRSQQGQISSKRLEIASYAVFDKIMFTGDVYDGSKHTRTQTRTYVKTPPRCYRDNIRVGGYFTSREITLVSTLMKPNTHGDMGHIGELPQGHGKVISRSQQGQISSKSVKIACFCWFCYNYVPLKCLWSLEAYLAPEILAAVEPCFFLLV